MGSTVFHHTSLAQPLSRPDFADLFNGVLQNIECAARQAHVTAALHEAVRLLGFDGGAFLSFVRSDESRESFKFTVACSAKWCQAYAERGWYLGDPGLVYAQTASTPILLDDLPIRSPLQQEIIDSARSVGFVSGVIVPSHTSSGRNRLGVLYLGSNQSGYVTPETLQRAKIYVRALSSEMLDWWNRTLRDRVQNKVQLSDADLTLMRLCAQGMKSKQIADQLAVTVGSIDQRVARITTKLGADGRKDAVAKLRDAGLLAV